MSGVLDPDDAAVFLAAALRLTGQGAELRLARGDGVIHAIDVVSDGRIFASFPIAPLSLPSATAAAFLEGLQAKADGRPLVETKSPRLVSVPASQTTTAPGDILPFLELLPADERELEARAGAKGIRDFGPVLMWAQEKKLVQRVQMPGDTPVYFAWLTLAGAIFMVQSRNLAGAFVVEP